MPRNETPTESRIPTPVSMKLAIPSDKPLPSPPIVQLAPKSPIHESRTLIDAVEKPLRRSPPGNPNQEEEWPVLFPSKPTTPNTLREMFKPIFPESSGKLCVGEPEGSEKTASAAEAQLKPMRSLKPSKTVSSVHSISRKAVPIAGTATTAAKENAAEPNIDASQIKASSEDDTPINALSAAAAAVEKSSDTSNPLRHPRQTRTSSLRARISAGTLVKEGPISSTKVVGFTDFTTTKEHPLTASKSFSRSPMDLQSTSKGRFPIKVDANIRKTTSWMQHRALKDSGSSHDSSDSGGNPNGLSPMAQTGVATAVPFENILNTVTSVSLNSGSAQSKHAMRLEKYRNSTSDGNPFVSTLTSSSGKPTNVLRNAFAISEEPSNTTKHSTNTMNERKADLAFLQDSGDHLLKHAAQSTSAARREAFTTKRLSATSPDLGPVLRISSSAEKIIMGHDHNKENLSTNNPFRRKASDLRRSTVTKELHKAAQNGMSRVTDGRRPMTSQGLSKISAPQTSTQIDLRDREARLKKAKSAEMSSTVPAKEPLQIPVSHRMSTTPHLSTQCQAFPLPSGDDPFFDARSHQDNASRRSEKFLSGFKDEEHGLTALNASMNTTITCLSNSVNEIVVPPITQNHGESNAALQPSIAKEDGKTADVGIVFEPPEPRDHTAISIPKPAMNDDHTETSISKPATKNDHIPKSEWFPPRISSRPIAPDCIPTSNNFPPRDSSRAAAMDFSSGKFSPYVPTNHNNHQPTDFIHRQNKLGTTSGLITIPLDIGPKSLTKRDSTAELSARSHTSLSKGVLSNVRGFFHKRSFDPDTISKASKTKKPSQKQNPPTHPTPIITRSNPQKPPIPTISPIHLSKPLPTPPSSATPTPTTTHSPEASQMASTTALAMKILEEARLERDGVRKERLLQLGTVMVEVLTQAREAEKAMVEAKQAATRAEVAWVRANKGVGEVLGCVERGEGGDWI